MAPPAVITDLVERFERNRAAYRSGRYNETQVRREFVDPFFKALGWDIDNEQGYAEAYKDVIHEDAIRIAGGLTAPDYCFRIGGARKFFVEAKRPAVDVRGDTHPAYQLRRYAWSAKLPLSILTDFEEFAVYDCRLKPAKTDKAGKARTLYLTYDAYPDRWADIAAIFARDAILKGSFDKYAESTKRKRGTSEVDDAFLSEIESWRDLLARHIALRNPALSQRELNFAVQRTIDRIIFLRICEDRGVEPYGRLQALLNGEGIYGRLFELFDRADQRYNSGLFHFQREGNRDEPDALTPGLVIDDKPLKTILARLYYPDSPYEFSVLPADILGQVYEQFLGKVIRLTAGHRAVVEDKPEVKKAGGVYYTPTYIVDYIVEHTVGTLLDGKTPRSAAKLRILDPACGSGSFLLGAYQRLLDWHLAYYTAHGPEKWARGRNPRIYQAGTAGSRQLRAEAARAGGSRQSEVRGQESEVRGQEEEEGGGQSAAANRKSQIGNRQSSWRLTTAERKRILLNNIFGVDIDPQAVEVTKLSLLLKVLEGESGEALQRQYELFHDRVLPDLSANIKCGNSLIGPDFYKGQQLTLFDEDERLRINVFDWHTEFPDILKGKAPGFDAVIGNPPYIRIQRMKEWAPVEVEHYKRRYVAASKGNYDIYVVFVERGLGLLNRRGRLGFIVPSKFLTTDYGRPLREMLAKQSVVDQLVDFGHHQVFRNATTYTCLLILDRNTPAELTYVRAEPSCLPAGDAEAIGIRAETLGGNPWLLTDRGSTALVKRLSEGSLPLLDLPALICRGTSTGADAVFCLNETPDGLRTRSGEKVCVEEGILRRPLYASDFTRYHSRPRNQERVIFPYEVSPTGYEPLAEERVRDDFPLAYEYLRANKKALSKRKSRGPWYGFSAPRSLNVHDHADLMIPLLADRGLCAPLLQESARFCVMASAGFSITLPSSAEGPNAIRYVLGLVNSKLLFWYLRQLSNKFRGGWITCTKQYFGKLPIKPHSDNSSLAVNVSKLVEQILTLHEEAESARTAHQQTALRRQIAATDREIDGLVYELYGLTEAEIAIVESACP